ncbi:hypothetical protein ACFWY5_52565 [Nonomuraea sp. NPDC059007]
MSITLPMARGGLITALILNAIVVPYLLLARRIIAGLTLEAGT